MILPPEERDLHTYIPTPSYVKEDYSNHKVILLL